MTQSNCTAAPVSCREVRNTVNINIVVPRYFVTVVYGREKHRNGADWPSV